MGTVSFVAGPPVPVPLGIQTPLPYRRRERGSALEMDEADRFSFGDDSSIQSLSAFTYLALFKPYARPTGGHAVVWKGTTNKARGMEISNTGEIDVLVGTSATYGSSTTNSSPITLNAWQWVGGTFAWPLARIYHCLVGGEMAEQSYSLQQTATGTLLSNAGQDLYVGAYGGGGAGSGLNGVLAAVLVWNRQLSLSELRAATKGRIPTSGLVLHARPGFGGEPLTTIRDLSGTGNDGTLV